MTRGQMKSHFVVHTNGQDEWIKVDKRIYDKAIDMFCAAHEAELKAKDERIAELKEGAKNTAEIYAKQLAAKDKEITELEAMLQNMCAECECAKFADEVIKPNTNSECNIVVKRNRAYL